MSVDIEDLEMRPHLGATSPESTDIDSSPQQEVEASGDEYRYRALSAAAVLSLLLGMLAPAALFGWSFAVLPLAGIATGIVALVQIRRRPEELTGGRFALTGVLLSIVCWTAGWAWLTYEYLTEVPPGHLRISYSMLQPDSQAPLQPVPPSAMELDGKDIFIKGYLYPGSQQSGIMQFLLVRDQGDCCFGGDPKITDRIQVTLRDRPGVSFTNGVRKFAGRFHVRPGAAVDAGGGVLYHLEGAFER